MDLKSDQQENYISIWAKAVETQMHFNEMSVKSRQLGLTFVAAALGVAVVLLSRGDDFAYLIKISTYEVQIHISVLLVLGALLALAAVRVLDLNVYHRMLRGAVSFGEDFEEQYMKQIFDLDKGMTQSISHFSRYADAGTEISTSGKYKYTGTCKVTAEDKIKGFYRKGFISLSLIAVVLLIFTNVGIRSDAISDPPLEIDIINKMDIETPNGEKGAKNGDKRESSDE